MLTSKHPPLYYKSKTGAIIVWRVWSQGEHVHTEWGQKDGATQTAIKIARPTNEGRSNAKTAEQQASFEARALYDHKLSRKYSKTIDEAKEPLTLPMLAHRYDQQQKKVVFPCHGQPKLDGVRCRACWVDGKIKLYSRSGRDYYVQHIEKALTGVMPKNCELDGELYVHGVSCTKVGGWVDKPCADTLRVQYHVYDMPVVNGDDKRNWSDRRAALSDLRVTVKKVANTKRQTLSNQPDVFPVKILVAVTINSYEDVDAYQKNCVGRGYEGAMLRMWNGLYEWGRRAYSLLKVKTFHDSDYRVVGIKEGRGKMKGCAIFICQCKGRTFDCVMRGTMEERRTHYAVRKEMLKKPIYMKVRHFGFTDYNVPWHPVGLDIRSAKDI